MVMSERAHAFLRPRITVAGRNAGPIEQARSLLVRHQPGQIAHEHDGVFGQARMVPAGGIQPLLLPDLCVVATLPVQNRMNDRTFAGE